MRPIYINGRFLSQGLTGVQRHATEMVRALDRLVEEGATPLGQEWTLLIPTNARDFHGLTKMAVRSVGSLRGHLWEQLELPHHARTGLLLNFANTAPLTHKHQVVTMHDASVFTVPQAYTIPFRLWYRFLFPRIGRRAISVVTDSEFSRFELSVHAGIPVSHQRVVPLGCEHILSVIPDQSILGHHEISERPFILAVGSTSPHKNLGLLGPALSSLSHLNSQLVLVGPRNASVFKPGEWNMPPGTKWLGYVSDGALRALYERAACFIYPSLYEGFGLPPLEAMACGCPTLVSRAASLPEVCGDAVLYFDPHDPNDLARGVRQVLSSAELRQTLRERGQARSRHFTWERAARITLELLSEILNT